MCLSFPCMLGLYYTGLHSITWFKLAHGGFSSSQFQAAPAFKFNTPQNCNINGAMSINYARPLLVGGFNPSEKILVIVSWDDEIPKMWKVIIHSCSKPTTSYVPRLKLWVFSQHPQLRHSIRANTGPPIDPENPGSWPNLISIFGLL